MSDSEVNAPSNPPEEAPAEDTDPPTIPDEETPTEEAEAPAEPAHAAEAPAEAPSDPSAEERAKAPSDPSAVEPADTAEAPSEPSAEASAKPSKPSPAPIISGKCDVCTKPDQFEGHFLQKCKECGVRVHELCYCMIPKDIHDPEFICQACASVGKDIEVNEPSRIGGSGRNTGKHREVMTQLERPSECVLCSHHDGIHAMHPLYDTHGLQGRQLVLPRTGDIAHRKEKRLAWVHTLCATFVADYFQTRGFIYGCDEHGIYDGMSDEENEEEEEDPDDGDNEDFCNTCKKRGELICCDGCVKSFHLECLKVDDPESLPDPWYCSFCESSKKSSTEDGVDKEDTDKEGNEESSTGEDLAKFEIGTKVSKYFVDDNGKKRPFSGEVVSYFPKRKRYRIRYDEDGEEEDLTEMQVAKIEGTPGDKLSATNHFVLVSKKYPTEYNQLKEQRGLKCVICNVPQNRLKIPVQCTAGTDYVLSCFTEALLPTKQDRRLGNQGCLKAMHVGCARWKAREKYVHYKGKVLRMCYMYHGQKATFEEEHGDIEVVKDPKSNIFCREHCHKIIDGQR